MDSSFRALGVRRAVNYRHTQHIHRRYPTGPPPHLLLVFVIRRVGGHTSSYHLFLLVSWHMYASAWLDSFGDSVVWIIITNLPKSSSAQPNLHANENSTHTATVLYGIHNLGINMLFVIGVEPTVCT